MRVASIFKTAAAAILIGSLGACATPFRADVSRFQQMPAPQGQTFAIVAADAEDAGGLEFSHYASLVAAELSRAGYRPAVSGDTADLKVTLDYGVDQGRERVIRDPGFGDPFWGPGWGRGGFYGPGFYGRGFYGHPVIVRTRGGYRYMTGFNDPFLFGPGWGSFNESSYTVYTSGINLLIERNGTGEHLFEGSAEAVSRDNDLTRLVPNLVAALFTGFPGNSGEQIRISLPPPPRQR